MNSVILASSQTEAAALETARTRLAEAAGTLRILSANLVFSAANAAGSELAAADQAKLVGFAERDILPLASALAGALGKITVGKTADAGAAVLATLAAGHSARLAEAVTTLEGQEDPLQMVSAGARLQEAASAFLDQAAELIVPALAQNPGVDLAAVLPPETVDEPAAAADPNDAPAAAPGHGGCACGGHDEPGLSELDTRVIPHAIRHATIFGALDGLTSGRGILLIANHNPLPLLAQLTQRAPGAYQVDYVENGPDVWRLSMVRN